MAAAAQKTDIATSTRKQLTTLVGGLNGSQRMWLIGGAIVTLATLLAFVHFTAKPDYVPLATGMEPSDAQALIAKLTAKDIPAQAGADGTSVTVPADKIDSSRMEMASDGMPRSGRMGFELFDKMNWGQTEFDEKVNYQRALEAELERSIQTLKDVESVRVHLVMPKQSVFLDRERPAKASIILKLRTGYLPEESLAAIARLASGAVENLSPEDVTVVDSATRRPLGARHNASAAGGEMEEQLSARLMQTLAPVVGADHVRASINVEYDSSTREENEETYDPKSAVAVATQKSEEQMNGGVMGGVPGTASNVPSGTGAPAKVDAANGSNQLSRSENNTFAVNRLVRRTIQPAGRIHRVTAALLVDDATELRQANGKTSEVRRKRSPEELKQIEELAKASIGIDVARGDFLSVQNLSFAQAPVETPASLPVMSRVRMTLNDWSGAVRYAVILLLFAVVYMMLLRPVKKQFMTTLRQLPASSSAQLGTGAQASLTAGSDMAALAAEHQRASALRKQFVEKIRAEPAVTGRLIQAWIQEEA
ncbi:MAG TPA: flagellar basal-body MS-ring/collar protein FliF [Terriglobales bacterium]|nr:flagellar basal-body MS-ring/collar protein FliF [Terriglobales bacterium]